MRPDGTGGHPSRAGMHIARAPTSCHQLFDISSYLHALTFRMSAFGWHILQKQSPIAMTARTEVPVEVDDSSRKTVIILTSVLGVILLLGAFSMIYCLYRRIIGAKTKLLGISTPEKRRRENPKLNPRSTRGNSQGQKNGRDISNQILPTVEEPRRTGVQVPGRIYVPPLRAPVLADFSPTAVRRGATFEGRSPQPLRPVWSATR
jgi:hypothetical protein